MVVHLPRLIVLAIFSLMFLACKLFTPGLEETASLEQTLPPPAISTRASTPTPSGTPIAIPSATPEIRPTITTTPISLELPLVEPSLMAFITAPKGVSPRPFVILSAYGAAPGDSISGIKGKIGPVEFNCPGSRCLLPVLLDSMIAFHAYTQSGNSSPEVTATVRMNWSAEGYTVSIESLSPVVIFADYCGEVWELGAGPKPNWAMFPQSPEELGSSTELHYLAGQLIANGVVDAESCPGGGLTPTGPNTCGLEQATGAMLEWQNQYDYNLWLTGKDLGVPPVLLKTLFEQESQFWPVSQRYFLDEYGLAQVNELGADVALRWDIDLYQDVCSQTLSECPYSYYRLRPSLRAMLRGSLLSQVYVDCPTCPYGVDMTKALESIPVNALILRYNCNDTQFILEQNDYYATYEDYWKFSMVAYHSGINCLNYAIGNVVRTGFQITWSQVADQLRCSGAREYVEDLWTRLETFPDRQLTAEQAGGGAASPVLAPTQTPIPTPTMAVSNARIRVQVYVDVNGDGFVQDAERVNGIRVLVNTPDGVEQAGNTENGETIFDLSGFPIGMGVTVSLPDYYRNEWVTLPADGEVLVVFRFTGPPFPTALP